MPELNKHICKKCNQVKDRVDDGRYPNGNKRYRDSNGELWSGKTCPSCTRDRLKNHMRTKRSSNGTDQGSEPKV